MNPRLFYLEFGRESYNVKKFGEEIRKAEVGSSKGGIVVPVLGAAAAPNMLPTA